MLMHKNDDNKAFSFSYSAASNEELEHFKKKYSPNEPTEKIKRVRALDKRVDFITTMISIALGLCGTALLLAGAIQAIKNVFPLPYNIIILAIGLAIDSVVPFIHGKIYRKLKSYFAPQILALIREIEQNQL